MEVSSALRIIESALNERKALARVAEVLEIVADAERRTAELEDRIAAQKVEVDGLDRVLAGLAEDIESAHARAVLDADSAREAFDREALVWAGKIAEIEAYHEKVSDKVSALEDAHVIRVEEMHAIILKLQTEANDAEDRLGAARKAMVAFKAKL